MARGQTTLRADAAIATRGRETISRVAKASRLPAELETVPFTVRQAAAYGLTRRRTRARDLTTPFRGVRTSPHNLDLVGLCKAYATRMPQGQVFSHRTAAMLWKLPLPDSAPLPLHVAVPAPLRQPRMKGVVGHRLGTHAETRFIAGLPVVAPCDAWCQLADSLGPDDLVAAGDRLLGWRDALATLDELDRAIVRFGSRPGVAALRRARIDIRPRSASRRETLLRLNVLRHGYPEPECNGAIELSAGWMTHGDLVFRRYRVLLEYDGEQHRTDDRQFHRDVERLNDLATDGWIVIRVGRRLPLRRALAQLDRALRARGWSGPAR
jgi:hypothetical protein